MYISSNNVIAYIIFFIRFLTHQQQLIPRLRTPIVIPAEEQPDSVQRGQPEGSITAGSDHLYFERRNSLFYSTEISNCESRSIEEKYVLNKK